MEQFPADYRGVAVDVGANNGEFESNTLLLEDAGWNVLCIEAAPRYAIPLSLCRKKFALCAVDGSGGDWASFYAGGSPTPSEQMLVPRRGATTCPHQNIIRVPLLTLDMVLHIFGYTCIDVLSMDIEGGELDALRGFDIERWDPKVIVCEDLENENLLLEYLEPFGFRFDGTRQFDRCFVRKDV